MKHYLVLSNPDQKPLATFEYYEYAVAYNELVGGYGIQEIEYNPLLARLLEGDKFYKVVVYDNNVLSVERRPFDFYLYDMGVVVNFNTLNADVYVFAKNKKQAKKRALKLYNN